MRSPKYLRWIRKLRCCNCNNYGCDPHHLIGFKDGSTGGKAGDELAVPLCRGCHTTFHKDPVGWNQLRWLSITLKKAFEEEALQVCKKR